MRLFLASFLFFTILFSCNTQSNTLAYKDYSKHKKLYINAILDNNEKQKRISLKEIVACGEFLGFDVSKYKERLTNLSKKHNIYLKITSFEPLTIAWHPDYTKNQFTLKSNYIKKVMDIKNATLAKPISKRFGNIYLKIGQFDKNTVRIVYYSKTHFPYSYNTVNGYLKIKAGKQKKSTPTTSKKSASNTPKRAPIKKEEKKSTSTIDPKKFTIVIDPGHGGKDPGGVGYKKIQEKNIVFAVSRYLSSYLKKKGYKVYMTRTKDKYITLKTRTRYANKKKADIFISVHANVSPKTSKTSGFETYFLSPARSARAKRVAKIENSVIGNIRSSTTQKVILNFLNKNKIVQSDKLAIDIQKYTLHSLREKYKSVKDGGVREAPFWVLVGAQMPAVLIELGYLTNPTEALRLNKSSYQKRLAEGISEGIDSYFQKNRSYFSK